MSTVIFQNQIESLVFQFQKIRYDLLENEVTLDDEDLDLKTYLTQRNLNPKELGEITLAKLEFIFGRYKAEKDELISVFTGFQKSLMEFIYCPYSRCVLLRGEHEAKINYIKLAYMECIKQLKDSLIRLSSDILASPRRVKKNGKKAFNARTTEILTAWYERNKNHPYPTINEKLQLCFICDLSVKQVNTWFGNKRGREKQKDNDNKRIQIKKEDIPKIPQQINDKRLFIEPPYYIPYPVHFWPTEGSDLVQSVQLPFHSDCTEYF